LKPRTNRFAGATVKARCQCSTSSFRSTAAERATAPDVVTTSDERGRYAFDASTLAKCWVVFRVRGEAGYQTTGEAVWRSLLDSEPGHAPGPNGSDVWMMPLEAPEDRYLRILAVRSEPLAVKTSPLSSIVCFSG
jgi:hypothetical protein